MRKMLITLLAVASVTAGCGNNQSNDEDLIGGANEPTSIYLESDLTKDASSDSNIDCTWETVSNGLEYHGEIQPEYYVHFTDDEIIYGHMKDGVFVLDHADEINYFYTSEKADKYIIQATSSNGTQYTFKTSADDKDILEYFGTWNEDEYENNYSGSSSLVRSNIE